VRRIMQLSGRTQWLPGLNSISASIAYTPTLPCRHVTATHAISVSPYLKEALGVTGIALEEAGLLGFISTVMPDRHGQCRGCGFIRALRAASDRFLPGAGHIGPARRGGQHRYRQPGVLAEVLARHYDISLWYWVAPEGSRLIKEEAAAT
jgi:hypothetical protein